MKAAILAIGTEITTGEILNSNARWLSNELVDLGFEVDCHLAVPDETEAILAALDFVCKNHEIIFTTGGLGPTSDDFTRDIIASWCQKKLIFDEASWGEINDRLNSFGVVVSQSNRQQCFFPENSEIIDNPRGTANAFHITHADTEVFCLPGPPREIEGIWQGGLQKSISKLNPTNKKVQLLLWHCLGVSESALGEIVERALDGSGYLTGYRPHVPYVEIKVWLPITVDTDSCIYLKKLEEEIIDWVVYRGTEDIAGQLLTLLDQFEQVQIEDCLTLGVLSERLGFHLRGQNFLSIKSKLAINTSSRHQEFHESFDSGLKITLSEFNLKDRGWTVSIVSKDMNVSKSKNFTYPRKVTEQNLGRMYRYCCEASIAYCSLELEGLA